jgi:hypothetical protein
VNARRVRHTLEVVTNTALLVVSGVVVFVLVGGNIAPSRRAASPTWQVGETFPDISALSANRGEETLVLAVSATESNSVSVRHSLRSGE